MPQPTPKEISISTTVTLSQQAWEFLDANKANSTAGERLAAYTRWFMAKQAQGGLMLEPTDMDYLASLNQGRRFESSRDVVAAVEVALKRDDGQFSFKINVDPTLVKPLEEAAAWQGLTAEQLLDMVCNQCMQNGWCYEFSPSNGLLLPLGEQEVLALRKLTGKANFTGADVVELLSPKEAKPAAKPEPVAAVA